MDRSHVSQIPFGNITVPKWINHIQWMMAWVSLVLDLFVWSCPLLRSLWSLLARQHKQIRDQARDVSIHTVATYSVFWSQPVMIDGSQICWRYHVNSMFGMAWSWHNSTNRSGDQATVNTALKLSDWRTPLQFPSAPRLPLNPVPSNSRVMNET